MSVPMKLTSPYQAITKYGNMPHIDYIIHYARRSVLLKPSYKIAVKCGIYLENNYVRMCDTRIKRVIIVWCFVQSELFSSISLLMDLCRTDIHPMHSPSAGYLSKINPNFSSGRQSYPAVAISSQEIRCQVISWN